MKPDGGKHWYLKFVLFNLTKFVVCNIKGLPDIELQGYLGIRKSEFVAKALNLKSEKNDQLCTLLYKSSRNSL